MMTNGKRKHNNDEKGGGVCVVWVEDHVKCIFVWLGGGKSR